MKLDSTDLNRLVTAVRDVLQTHIDERLDRELEGRVRAQAMEIVTDVGEATIRDMIREAVRARVDVTVSLK